MGEHATGMLLALFNKLTRADRQVRQGIWKREENRGVELRGKTIGVIGYGNTGSAFAKCISGFGVKVIAYDKYKTNYSDNFVTEVKLEQLFIETDILSIHVPLTEETQYLVDQSFIDKFGKPIYIVNTSRGKVLNTKDLVDKLQTGKILGACLDVLEYEKTSFEAVASGNMPEEYQWLLQSENVILSPHIAGWTVESYYLISKVLAERIIEGFC